MSAIMKPLLLLATLAAGMAAGTGFRTRGFGFVGVSNRIITPNGDTRNDSATFQFSNPRDSAGTLKIYDLRGHLVTTLSVDPGSTSVSWDARVGGQIVNSGVYIYVLSVEDVIVSGAVVVVR